MLTIFMGINNVKAKHCAQISHSTSTKVQMSQKHNVMVWQGGKFKV